MHHRILFGCAAWLLGAATATAGSLLAVSLLGQGITGASGPLLTQDVVNRALTSETAEPAATAPASRRPSGAAVGRAATPGGTPSAPGPAVSSPGATPVPSPSASPRSTPGGTAPPGTTPPGTAVPGTTVPGTTVLGSPGGDVVADCLPSGAYLSAWSPAQGYLVGAVDRGPAQAVRVTFEPAARFGDSAVTMVVSCSAGVPAAVTSTGEGGDS